jgi:hypothetical protein
MARILDIELRELNGEVTPIQGVPSLVAFINNANERAIRCMLLHEPIVVSRVENTYRLITGHTSLAIARAILPDSETVPVICVSTHDPDARLIQCSASLFKHLFNVPPQSRSTWNRWMAEVGDRLGRGLGLPKVRDRICRSTKAKPVIQFSEVQVTVPAVTEHVGG